MLYDVGSQVALQRMDKYRQRSPTSWLCLPLYLLCKEFFGFFGYGYHHHQNRTEQNSEKNKKKLTEHTRRM